MAVHAGSWSILGQKLPDFGITEKISSITGGNRTAQGGSNVFGGQNAQTLGTQTQAIPSQYSSPIGPTIPTNPMSGGGGGARHGRTHAAR